MRRISSFVPPPIKKSLLLALAYVLMPAAMHADTTNLLTNPGAETGISGWTVTFGAPGVDTFDPDITPHTGSHDFSGDNAGLSQTVSVFTQGITAAMINAGTLSAQFSFWEQGVNEGTSSGFGLVFLEFFDGTTDLETATRSVDSHNGVWTEGVGTILIPIGTTTISYNMGFETVAGLGELGPTFIDDNSLIILAPAGTGTTPSPVPEPGTLALLGTGLVGLAGMVRRKLTA
jgi:PEP-CTERM motif-containing protein